VPGSVVAGAVSVGGGVVVVSGSVAGGGGVVAGESSVVAPDSVADGWVCVVAARAPVVARLVDSGVAGVSSSPPVRSMLAPKPTRAKRPIAAAAAR